MNIYLIWSPVFLLQKDDISIFDLEISQEENYFSKARLIIDALSPLPPPGTEGIIRGENDEVFFQGSLVGSPLKIEEDLAEIELIARPKNFLEQNAVLQKESRIPPYWDDLWVRPGHINDFQEVQDVRTASLYCDRRTVELSHSDWFEGKQDLPLGQDFFPNSLKMRVVGSPLKACTVNVHVNWAQSQSGVSSLSSSIRRAFPHFKVSTYTQHSLLKKWPEAGRRIGKSGIWVIKSELKPMFPTSPLYQRFSPAIPLSEEGDPPKPYRLERHWFKPTLIVGWQIQQRRKETLSLTLLHNFQSLYPGEAPQKTLEFTLQNINPDPGVYVWRPEAYYSLGAKVSYKNGIYRCKADHTSDLSFEKDLKFWHLKKVFHTPLGDPARGSFFLTDRGYQAAEHAMERAKLALAKSARCLEVSFEGLWESFKNVTTDTSVTLTDPRLPGGEIRGKVVKYSLIAKGETGERFGSVTLLCALGTGQSEPVEQDAIPHYALDEYCEDLYQVHENTVRQTPSGLTYFRYDECAPQEEFRYGPLLRGVDLENGPDEQEAEIGRHAHTSPVEVKKALSQKPTRLRLFFKDLRTKERLEHLIPVRMAAAWSAPTQCSAE
ncbi:MAG TPA: hypothetical protein VMW10_12405 [Alphaproteobacteria bacterium]|nr:hypothetical protein [Alphaproteobacteria bacterium]